jgi:hypothetical protein
MRAASINKETNLVDCIIVADATTDVPHDGMYLVNISDDSFVAPGWLYDQSTGMFTDQAGGQ